jgi:hypothetical protein
MSTQFDSYQDFTHKLGHYRETEGFPKWSQAACNTAGYWFNLAWRNNRNKSFQALAGYAWRAMNTTMEELSDRLTAERRVYSNGGSPLWMLVMANPGIEQRLSTEEQNELKVITLM